MVHMKNKSSIFFIIFLLLAVLIVTGCGDNSNNNTNSNSNSGSDSDSNSGSSGNSQSNQSQTDNDDNNSQDSEEPSESIDTLLTNGVHSNTFVLDANGNNNSCAQCHSPINWMPSMDDVPETCLVCKFEISKPEPLVMEDEWTDIPCMICHKIKKDEVQEEIYYLEIAPIEEYASVDSPTELCQYCHRTSEGLVNHPGTIVEGAHTAYGCEECHNSHSGTATCSNSGCHSTFGAEATAIIGHDADHDSVTCAACHDGSSLEVGQNEDGAFVTLYAGSEENYPFYSHNIVLETECARCHYTDNPWALSDAITQP